MPLVSSPLSSRPGGAGGPSSPVGAILMIMAGAAAILLPLIAGFGVLSVVAALFLLNGGAHVVHSLSARRLRSFAWHALIGLLYVSAGIYILAKPAVGLASLALLMAVLFLLEGGLLIGGYIVTRGMRGAGWMLGNGVLSALLGLLILAVWPVNSGEIVGLLLGMNLMIGGFSRLMHRPMVG